MYEVLNGNGECSASRFSRLDVLNTTDRRTADPDLDVENILAELENGVHGGEGPSVGIAFARAPDGVGSSASGRSGIVSMQRAIAHELSYQSVECIHEEAMLCQVLDVLDALCGDHFGGIM